MDGALAYSLFYISFLVLMIFFTAIIPVDLISGITQEQIDRLNNQVTLGEPTLLNYLIYPFTFIYDLFNKMFVLISVSSAHQFIAILLTPFTIAFLLVIASFIRGN